MQQTHDTEDTEPEPELDQAARCVPSGCALVVEPDRPPLEWRVVEWPEGEGSEP